MPTCTVALEAIAASGALAGLLDILATSALMRAQGVPLQRLLQFIASGAFGATAFEGRNRTATLGIVLHFFIAFALAAVFYALTLPLPMILRHPWFCGALFGAVVHLAMSFIIVPLSRAAKRTFNLKAWITQLAVHILCVGMPIALVQHTILQ
ncbi:hypothetical protein GOB94_08250 [Granulicella sp. 5B5]|uniref:hypothetical protein n=1 Tax=Granulicella sp. 5B5 TaxID=1617967 RepID=UPI0015F383B2|nr:hypothetical protein [Granulicella sp. 5B5]QMV18670.1 hypothetical protein GOB94_08250 [Granulicella sp. 5B5]